MLTEEIEKKISSIYSYSEQMNVREKVLCILSWTCLNSVKQTQKFLVQNSKLAKCHFLNKSAKGLPYIEKSKSDLQSLYSYPVSYRSVHQVSVDLFRQVEAIHSVQKQKILKKTQRYGERVKVKSQKYDEIRERQIQMVIHTEKVHQKYFLSIEPYPQNEKIKQLDIKFPSLKFKFDQKLKISENFMKCTKISPNQDINSQDLQSNELQYCYFVYVKPKSICMITIRQANYLIKNNVPIATKLFWQIGKKRECISRLSDLSLENQFIKINKLGKALVQCKFYNGVSVYSSRQKQILQQFLFPECNQQSNICYFLKRRRMLEYYGSSSLEQLYQELLLMKQQPRVKL